MKNILYHIYISIFFGLFFSACSDSDNMDTVTEQGTITISMENKFVNESITLSDEYTSANGDKVNFTRFEYIISNVTLIDNTGASYLIPNSYYIMGQRNAASAIREDIEIKDIPVGMYTGIKFSVGVDPTTNANTDTYEKGDLQAGIGMDWGWASGYKFIRWDGTYFNDNENNDINFSLHVGTDDNFRTVELTFPQSITINSEMQTAISFNIMADKIFEEIDLNDIGLNFPPSEPVKTFTGIMLGPADKATIVANAYQNMFELQTVSNSQMN